jgi:hypothetical protein
MVFGYLSLVTTLIAVACSQFDKLNWAILDVRQQYITPYNQQEDEQNYTIASCKLQAKLNAYIRHHQKVMA